MVEASGDFAADGAEPFEAVGVGEDGGFARGVAHGDRLGGFVCGALLELEFVEAAVAGAAAAALAFAEDGLVDAGLKVVGKFLEPGGGDKVGGGLNLVSMLL